MHNQFFQLLLKELDFSPTPNQKEAMQKLADFVCLNDTRATFILKGYAGTGKTSLIAALINTLPSVNKFSLLMAPTGRAAKVLANYAGKQAFTIHKLIYQLRSSGGYTRFVLKENKFNNTIFIVDESSMISDDVNLLSAKWGESNSLLDDLMRFVFSNKTCKLILVGDTAQLPPVGMDFSPALDGNEIANRYRLLLHQVELTQVVRQDLDSTILVNATYIRQLINLKKIELPLFKDISSQVKNVSGEFLEDDINECYSKYGEENTIVICRSNKRANLFNLQIRARIRWLEDEIAAGDYLMVVKNNYFWLDETSKAGFIANGDIMEIERIQGYEEMYGFRFANTALRLVDYPNHPSVEVKILLNSILSESPSLPGEEFRKLYDAVAEDYVDIPSRKKRNEEIRKNPYYQALQVKFAYAVTCHKSQGGQWDAVFVDQGYLTDEMIDVSYLRWLYTAITRARKELYLVNFNTKILGLETDI